MTTVNPRQFLDDQVPVSLRPTIASALQTAYRTADRLRNEEPWLQTPSAEFQHGRLISLAVDYGLVRLIESGSLPFDYSWEYFARPTGKYLAIRPPQSVLTVSQVADPAKQPRNVIFRQNRRVNNQPFFDLDEFADEVEVTGEPHFILAHGYQGLNFAHLGVPDPVHKNGYRYRTDNLMHLPREIESDGPPAENTDSALDDLNLLKQDIERWREDNGKDD